MQIAIITRFVKAEWNAEKRRSKNADSKVEESFGNSSGSFFGSGQLSPFFCCSHGLTETTC